MSLCSGCYSQKVSDTHVHVVFLRDLRYPPLTSYLHLESDPKPSKSDPLFYFLSPKVPNPDSTKFPRLTS